jgi:hypothetical protein
MDNTEGIEGNVPLRVLTFAEKNPFGIPGVEYSKSYPVTSIPLYKANVKAELRLRDLLTALMEGVGSLSKSDGGHSLDDAYEEARNYLANRHT